ncbi:MAG: 4Fe-4S dicluster domain-containing protein [Candidatus Riflemargulisbacteria bacterium]
MVVRKFIEINEDKCNGCGNCVVDCVEGALQIINGKAKVVKEQFCDGLGACIGGCPLDALKIVERDVAEFDEKAVEEHLKSKAQSSPKGYTSASNNLKVNSEGCGGGCPGTRTIEIKRENNSEINRKNFCGEQGSKEEATQAYAEIRRGATDADNAVIHENSSCLTQWPVQLHLISPQAPYLKGANLLVAASCSAFAYGNFHHDFIKNHIVVIACPKLDRTEPYIDKLTQIIKEGGITSITVVRMEVPCCGGLSHMVKEAITLSGKKLPYLEEIITVDGKRK